MARKTLVLCDFCEGTIDGAYYTLQFSGPTSRHVATTQMVFVELCEVCVHSELSSELVELLVRLKAAQENEE